MTDRLRYLRQAKAIPGEETAYVLTRRTVHEQRFVIRPCTENDLPMIMLIQRRVRRRVPSRSLYVMSPRRHVLESIRKDYAIGAWKGKRLVGFSMVLSLRETDRNLAYDLGYDPDYALRCATFDGAWIDPAYQGYGLQQCFCMERERYARSIGAAEMSISRTRSPFRAKHAPRLIVVVVLPTPPF